MVIILRLLAANLVADMRNKYTHTLRQRRHHAMCEGSLSSIQLRKPDTYYAYAAAVAI